MKVFDVLTAEELIQQKATEVKMRRGPATSEKLS
jgi:hypothetical protein